MIKKILIFSAGILALAALFAAPSSAQEGSYTDPDGEPVITVDPANAEDGTGGSGSGGSDDDELARTGSTTETVLKVGGGLLLAGAAATLFATKRRSVTA